MNRIPPFEERQANLPTKGCFGIWVVVAFAVAFAAFKLVGMIG